jgi:hypothetical protein
MRKSNPNEVQPKQKFQLMLKVLQGDYRVQGKLLTSNAALPVTTSLLSMSTSATRDLPPLVGAQYTRLQPSSTLAWFRHSACNANTTTITTAAVQPLLLAGLGIMQGRSPPGRRTEQLRSC